MSSMLVGRYVCGLLLAIVALELLTKTIGFDRSIIVIMLGGFWTINSQLQELIKTLKVTNTGSEAQAIQSK